MPKIFITGSSGFLGHNLLKYAPKDHTFLAQYRQNIPQSYGRPIELVPFDFVNGKWEKLEKLEMDVIIHTAAMGSLDECEMQPVTAEQINYSATCQLVDLAVRQKCRFIFISSDVVFDGGQGNYSEQNRPAPLNVYGRTKVAAEKYILGHHPDSVVVRPSLFYGRALNGRSSFTEIMLNHLHAGKQVYAFTDQYRTPLLVNNLVSAIWELVGHSFRGILHLGGPQRLNRLEIGKLLCKIFKLDENLLIPIRSGEIKLPARRPLDCSLDSSRAASLLQTTFSDCATGLHLAYR